ncbi:type II toxin-antitoxin system YafO family toxin [Pseudomonas sp.]
MDQANEFGRIFGRDKGFLFPEIVVKNGLQHVHMEEQAVERQWEAVWERNGPQDDYTSDKILVYGGIPDLTYPPHLHPIMLVDILTPLGHKLMDDLSGMRAMGEAFIEESQAYSIRLPAHKWIYTK